MNYTCHPTIDFFFNLYHCSQHTTTNSIQFFSIQPLTIERGRSATGVGLGRTEFCCHSEHSIYNDLSFIAACVNLRQHRNCERIPPRNIRMVHTLLTRMRATVPRQSRRVSASVLVQLRFTFKEISNLSFPTILPLSAFQMKTEIWSREHLQFFFLRKHSSPPPVL